MDGKNPHPFNLEEDEMQVTISERISDIGLKLEIGDILKYYQHVPSRYL